MLIGEIAKKSGFSRDTIRYYEKIGLIHVDSLDRHPNNYRNYPPQILQRLSQITEFKSVGFTLAEIIELLKSFESANYACANLPEMLDSKISRIREKIESLKTCKRALVRIKKACDGKCNTSSGLPDCVAS